MTDTDTDTDAAAAPDTDPYSDRWLDPWHLVFAVLVPIAAIEANAALAGGAVPAMPVNTGWAVMLAGILAWQISGDARQPLAGAAVAGGGLVLAVLVPDGTSTAALLAGVWSVAAVGVGLWTVATALRAASGGRRDAAADATAE